jgi:hypothetical protein
MDRDPTAAAEFDTATPSVARTFDYLLGGKDNYEVDRQAVEMLRMVAPEAPLTARMNREFGKRAVRYIAEQGIRQFRERMTPGSYLGISHLSARSAPDAIAHTHNISQQTGFPAVKFRPDEEVLQFFDGFDLVEPGLVDISEWHPEQDAPQVKIKLVGAVGRKAG